MWIILFDRFQMFWWGGERGVEKEGSYNWNSFGWWGPGRVPSVGLIASSVSWGSPTLYNDKQLPPPTSSGVKSLPFQRYPILYFQNKSFYIILCKNFPYSHSLLFFFYRKYLLFFWYNFCTLLLLYQPAHDFKYFRVRVHSTVFIPWIFQSLYPH